jgi:hypothetical protein
VNGKALHRMTRGSAHPDVARSVFVGREREMAQFELVLARRKPVLVVVVGQTGMGKTSLLRAFQARAAESGWKTVPTDDRSELFVIPATTEQTFRKQLEDALGILANERYVATALSRAATELETFLEQVYRGSGRSPNLVLIDGYRPSDSFAEWFTEGFIKGIKSIEASVVVIVACVPEVLERLRSAADEIIQLGPLDQEAVRRELQSFANELNPPMNSEELEIYTTEASKQPELAGDLLHVLSLARVEVT